MYGWMDGCSSGCSRADSLRLCKAAAEERLAQRHTCRGCYALLVIQYIKRYIHVYVHTYTCCTSLTVAVVVVVVVVVVVSNSYY